jgi:hypothetical protein
MIQKIVDEKYKFITMFNPQTGAYVRTGILNALGWDSGVDPFQASFPHLIDVGVMGHCIHGDQIEQCLILENVQFVAWEIKMEFRKMLEIK